MFPLRYLLVIFISLVLIVCVDILRLHNSNYTYGSDFWKPTCNNLVLAGLTSSTYSPATGVFLELSHRFMGFSDSEIVMRRGGYFKPTECVTVSTIAVIVAYRNRAEHLENFLKALVPYLIKQLRAFQIFVVEQRDTLPFNRAALFNIGVKEALQLDEEFSCFIFHDVDHIPENIENLYECDPTFPIHFSSSAEKYNYTLFYYSYLGGVLGFTKEQFDLIGGFSNCYWGWGAEDDDTYNRIQYYGLNFTRKPPDIGRYKTLPHNLEVPSPERDTVLNKSIERIMSREDGFFNTNYDVVAIRKCVFHTQVTVDLTKLVIAGCQPIATDS